MLFIHFISRPKDWTSVTYRGSNIQIHTETAHLSQETWVSLCMSLILNISIYYFPSSLYDNWASSHFRVTFYVIANIALGLQSSVFFFFFQTTAVSELLAFCPLPTSSALSLGHSWGKECALHIILQQSSPAVISLESKYGSGANFFFFFTSPEDI